VKQRIKNAARKLLIFAVPVCFASSHGNTTGRYKQDVSYILSEQCVFVKVY